MVVLFGHRGANRLHLENTMPAFEAALAAGLHGIELDIQRTRDGVLVVHHDFHLPDGRLLAALEYTELRLPDGYSVPTLQEVLVWAKKTGAYLNIEIKLETFATDGREREVATLVERSGIAQQIIISSFNPVCLWRVKRLVPALETALLFYNAPKMPWWLQDARTAPLLGVVALHPHFSQVTPEMVRKAHARGWKVNVWTVNDLAVAQNLIAMGVDGLIGDEPQVLLEANK